MLTPLCVEIASQQGYSSLTSLEFLQGLVETVNPKIVLELGTGYGASALFMGLADFDGNVITIDDYRYVKKEGKSKKDVIKNICSCNASDKITLLEGSTFDILGVLQKYNLSIFPEVIFMDASQNLIDLRKEYESLQSVLLKDHILIVDDLFCKETTLFVNELINQYRFCITIKEFHNGMAVLFSNEKYFVSVARAISSVTPFIFKESVEGKEEIKVKKEICICGNDVFTSFVHDSFKVSGSGKLSKYELSFGQCIKCGVIRQINLPFDTDKKYIEYYQDYPATAGEYTIKTWEHDVEVAEKRLKNYSNFLLKNCEDVLDIGSGSGAFVDVCRQQNKKAFGCELVSYHYSQIHDFIYKQKFEDIHFPTDSFDLVTCHDVLEHTLDPKSMIKEMYRVTKQEGLAVIEIPRFFYQSCNHHWVSDHVWFLKEEQLEKILVDQGFEIIKLDHPIETKVVFICKKPIEKRSRILIPPGIGDVYWTMVKMESFLEKMQLGLPDTTVMCPVKLSYGHHNRSIDFLRLFPFVHAMKEVEEKGGPFTNNSPLWKEAWQRQGRTIFTGLRNYDYGVSFNGYFRLGIPLEEINPEFSCNWNVPIFHSLTEQQYKEECIKKYGKYIVFHFILRGMFESHWLKEFTVTSLFESIRKVIAMTGYTPVFIGAESDKNLDKTLQNSINSVPGAINLVGDTSIEQLLGLMQGSKAVIGFPSGITIIAGALGVPTLTLYNDYYNRKFAWNNCPPFTRQKNYFVEWTCGLSVDRFSSEIQELAETSTLDITKYPELIYKLKKPLPSHSHRSVVSLPKPFIAPSKVINSVKVLPDYETRDQENANVTVVCVYKTGGDFDLNYVIKLRNMVARYTTKPYKFVCLTDDNIDPSICTSIKLTSDFKGWWNKLELFKLNLFDTDKVIYFDLDTLIINNMDSLLLLETEFAGLGDWFPGPNRNKKEYFGSGIMTWKNHTDLSFLFNEFDIKIPYRHGDQEYIVNSLIKANIKYEILQDLVPGIYSYKRNCFGSLPKDACVICFHGYPRPHQIIRKVNWVKNYWR